MVLSARRKRSTAGLTGHIRDSPDNTVPTGAPSNPAAEARGPSVTVDPEYWPHD